MEQLDARLGQLTLRARSLPVRHSAARLRRGLEPGEQVLVRDVPSGEYYYAAVADVDFEVDDTVYRLELGARITPAEAAEWLAPTRSAAPGGHVTTREIVELLAELRRGRSRLQSFSENRS